MTDKLVQVAARIREALGTTPYGALARIDFQSLSVGDSAGPLGLLEAVAAALESLQAVLVEVAAAQGRSDMELQELRDAVRGYGELQRLAHRLSEPAPLPGPGLPF